MTEKEFQRRNRQEVEALVMLGIGDWDDEAAANARFTLESMLPGTRLVSEREGRQGFAPEEVWTRLPGGLWVI